MTKKQKNSDDLPKMDRFRIAAALTEISMLLKLKKKDQYRSQAYARAARVLARVEGDFDELVRQHRLTEINGIGSSLSGVIEDLYATGHSSVLDKLRDALPKGVLELSQIPGLTLKRIESLNETLGIDNIADLKSALEGGKLQEVPGFGAELVGTLRTQLSKRSESDTRILLIHALRIGSEIVEYLKRLADIKSIDVAGSIRRWKETASSIRITAGVQKGPSNALKYFLSYPAIIDVEEKGFGSATVKLLDGVRVSFSVVTSDNYATLLFHKTGSESHLQEIAEVAKSKALEFTANGLKRAGRRQNIKVSTEHDIYRSLELQYIPPELREGIGEVEAARAGLIPEDLVQIEDVIGMIHCHTTYSDGRNSIEEMARAAESMGMKYMTISDHSPTAHYAGGVTLDRLKSQWDEISRVQEKVKIKLLRSTESDILRDGALDYPDHILEKFDLIIASIHNRYKLDEHQMTERIVAALKSPFFKVWGHPLGRLVGRRPPIDCRMEEILDVAAGSAAAIEISGDPHRLDLEPRWIREARKRPIKFVISTDAHSISDLHNLKFGIGIARRGGVRRGEVLNTLSLKDFKRAVAPR
jgi:DNA polymerase (family X)